MEQVRYLGLNPDTDFRAKATFGVAMVALTMVLPIAILDFYLGKTFIAIGALGVVFILGANAWTVSQGQCHQNLTLFGLMPAGMVFLIGVFYNDGLIGSIWCFPTVVAGYCMLSQRRAWISNATVLVMGLPMIWVTLEPTYAIRMTATLIAVSLFAAILVNIIDEQRQQLQDQVARDPLTGLLNRLTLKNSLHSAIRSHTQGLYKSSLLAVDIDFFKNINDTYGHDGGDRILVEFSALLHTVLRNDDVAFRTGGEEFLVILNFTDEQAAIEVGERVRIAVQSHDFPDNCKITISAGIAGYIPGENWTSWTKRADDRLYTAKRTGRNQVVAHDSIRTELTAMKPVPTLVS